MIVLDMDTFTFEMDGLVGDSPKNWWDRRPQSQAQPTSARTRRWKQLAAFFFLRKLNE